MDENFSLEEVIGFYNLYTEYRVEVASRIADHAYDPEHYPVPDDIDPFDVWIKDHIAYVETCRADAQAREWQEEWNV